MNIWCEFNDGRTDASVSLSAAPLVGDEVLWYATESENGKEYDTETAYTVLDRLWLLGDGRDGGPAGEQLKIVLGTSPDSRKP
ncbi:hypothetical protein Aph01nite_76930 [Acrocarpospora phusangensis]|uniref:Uncharacterized protein n=1 Tax=Acrocarpospora phusangensis TaxID=1070424 RepID=A0A919QKJ3_9ACTN|nr:hypothetical protein [Acrocarpospora phusangensis]GIH29383.1 hypothetical protein Aph01nite_76930 [Acrocarpospora phusangensis]